MFLGLFAGAAYPGLGVGDQVIEVDGPGFDNRRASLIWARCASGRPYAARARSSGAACLTLYHFSHSVTFRMRKSADKSTTRAPASTSALASPIATVLGVAKNTTSQRPRFALDGSENASATAPRRLGKSSVTLMPASLREVITASSACGCCARIRNSSIPV